MKKRLFNIQSLTLVELLAASMITVIMMIAIASMDISLRNLFGKPTANSIIATRLATAMNHIARSVNLAVGDKTGLTGWDMGVSDSGGVLHLRLEDNYTPSNYSDDKWFLYQYFGPPNYELRYCEANPNTISGACVTPIKTFSNIKGFTPTLTQDAATKQFHVKISLTGAYDATQISSPELTLTSAISLPDSGHTIPSP